ncbi:hypothetical protein [Stenotrophomonas sp. TWI819]|uniref:hypothetical protein n=1 Tax=unclassified Stenotrophomonas TaxID=196198 RepID=UPI003209ED12
MSEMDPHERINLTGPCAGFGFQAGHMFTPEGHQLEPCDMTWWSLTCNIAREWRLMMEEARPRSKVPGRRASEPLRHKDSSVINLRDVLEARRQRQLGMGSLRVCPEQLSQCRERSVIQARRHGNAQYHPAKVIGSWGV